MYHTFIIWETNQVYLLNKEQYDKFFDTGEYNIETTAQALAVDKKQHDTWEKATEYIHNNVNHELKLITKTS